MPEGGGGGIIVACVTLIVLSAGIGGLGVQSFDWDMRNAILRDLIELDWPVIYSYSDRGLCYYLAFFLPAAVIGKTVGMVLNSDMAWLAGNITLMIWTVINLSMIIILILDDKEFIRRNILIAVSAFLAFGGLAIVGYKIGTIFGTNSGNALDTLLIEHYANKITVANSNFTQLGNVFNQSVPAWLATCLFVKMKDKYCVFGIILFSLTLTSPFPMVGLAVLMLLAICEIKINNEKLKIVDIFSLSNVFSFVLVIIGFLYYRGNGSLHIHFNNMLEFYSIGQIILLVILVSFINFACYYLVIKRKKDIVFWGGCILVPVSYFILVGESVDFSMRTTIPYYFMLMIYVVETLVDNNSTGKVYLTVLLTISGITPFLTISNVAIASKARGVWTAPYDNTYTFRNKMNIADCEYLQQYTKSEVGEDLFFGKLCNVPVVIPQHPIVVLDIDDNNDFYISEATVTPDSIEEFLSIISRDNRELVLNVFNEEIAYGSEKVNLSLNEYKIRWESDVKLSEDFSKKINVVWENKKDRYRAGEYIHAKVRIKNESNVIIPPVMVRQVGNEKENIISLMCVEKDGEPEVAQLGYNLVNNPIYVQEEREISIYFQVPKDRGHYKIQIALHFVDHVLVSKYNLSNVCEYEFDVF